MTVLSISVVCVVHVCYYVLSMNVCFPCTVFQLPLCVAVLKYDWVVHVMSVM